MATEGKVSVDLLVYGYVRAEQPDEIEIALWCKEIKQFCEERDYCLQNVFVDRHEPDNSVERPALGGLMERLVLPETHGVAVPDWDHLSAKNEVLAVLRKNIRRTGSQVIMVHEKPDDIKADGV